MEPQASSPWPHAGLLSVQETITRKLKDFLEDSPPSTEHLPQDVGKLIQEIHTHAFKDLNVSAFLSRCRIHGHNVSTRFRWTVGLGPRSYLERFRIEAACRLLCQTDFAVYMIAMSVGYKYQETFCRAFQRTMGCSPSTYRRDNSSASIKFPSLGTGDDVIGCTETIRQNGQGRGTAS